MTGIGPVMKYYALLWPATLLSVAVHCLICVLFFFCLEANEIISPAPNVITVEIREPAPREETKPLSQPRKERAEVVRRRLTVTPTVPYQVPLTRPERLQSPQSSPLVSPERHVVRREITSISEGAGETSAKSLSIQAGSGKAATGMIMSPVGTEPTAPVAGTPDTDIDADYLAGLRELIERRKEYPLTARKGRMEGTARIGCIISRNGELRETKVISSSGYAILDNAALRAVRSAGRFPRVPARLKDDPFCFVAPITFRLSADRADD